MRSDSLATSSDPSPSSAVVQYSAVLPCPKWTCGRSWRTCRGTQTFARARQPQDQNAAQTASKHRFKPDRIIAVVQTALVSPKGSASAPSSALSRNRRRFCALLSTVADAHARWVNEQSWHRKRALPPEPCWQQVWWWRPSASLLGATGPGERCDLVMRI